MIADCNQREMTFSTKSGAVKNSFNGLLHNCCNIVEKKVECKKCQIKLSNRHSFYNHFKIKHPVDVVNILCEDCNRRFPYIVDLKLHVEEVHKWKFKDSVDEKKKSKQPNFKKMLS